MASIHAIAVTANAIRSLLADTCPRDVFPGAQFQLCQAAQLAASPFSDLGVSIYLHGVGFNTARRNLPPRTNLEGQRFKPSTPLDLHFLITAWARAAQPQWTLLAWVIRALEDAPVLPAGFLNQNAGSDHGGAPLTVFGPDEAVELVSETLTPQDFVNIWEVAKANQQPSVSVVARAVLIDSLLGLTDGPPVQTRVFDLGSLAS